MTVFTQILQAHRHGFRQTATCDCGPTSALLCAKGLGLRFRKKEDLFHPAVTGWVKKPKNFFSRGMTLNLLHTLIETSFGSRFSISLTRSYPENLNLFLKDLKSAYRGQCALILNFNQDFLLGRPYKSIATAVTHYSPVAGFTRDKLLVADVSAHIERAYWVSCEDAFKSMSEHHPIYKIPRGWISIHHRR